MKNCDPKDVSLKALFLGPQSENGAWLESEWSKILRHWLNWRKSRFPSDGSAISETDQCTPGFQARQAVADHNLDRLLELLENESPKFTPRYLGHMTSEVSLPAILGHLAVLLHNPNQTSREVSPVSSAIETEAVQDLLAMIGMNPHEGRGHFTSGGTLANLEGAWRFLYRMDRTLALSLFLLAKGKAKWRGIGHAINAGWGWFDLNTIRYQVEDEDLSAYSYLKLGAVEFARLYEELTKEKYCTPLILAPASRHFSWPKAATLLGFGSESLRRVPLDNHGRLSMKALAEAFSSARQDGRPIGMIVSVAGSTELGAVDPIEELTDFLKKYRAQTMEDVWHHVDAAYGGYFCSLLKEESPLLDRKVLAALRAIRDAHSVTLDPHKLGFVPYSCGAFLAKDQAHYRSFPFGAPYLLAENSGTWMHTIEGSRAGTGAAATWMSNRTIGLDGEGYGRLLERGLVATEHLTSCLQPLAGEIMVIGAQDLNIVCFALAREDESLKAANVRTRACFETYRLSPHFSLSKTSLTLTDYETLARELMQTKRILIDDTEIVCLRLVLMNPFLVTRETKTDFIKEFVEHLARSVSKVRKKERLQ